MLESYPNIPGLGSEAVLIAHMSSCVKEISGHIHRSWDGTLKFRVSKYLNVHTGMFLHFMHEFA